MSETTGAGPGEGSSQTGHVRQAVVTLQMRIDEAWRAYSQHIRNCRACAGGVDCGEAHDLRAAWRELVPPT